MADQSNLKLEVIAGEASLKTGDHAEQSWSIQRGRFSEGISSGVEVVEIRNGDLSFSVLPTRGMGIWQAHFGATRIGWDSPVRRPVHPGFVNLQSRNGLGWLDGFNELICRCGLSFNGPPGRDDAVGSPIESDLTLHGKIANLPAHSVEFIHPGEDQTIGVRGVVDESTLFGPHLRLESTMTTKLGESSIQIRDVVTNLGSAPTDLELLYHINLGSPVLEEGARFACPARRVIPRDSRAAEEVQSYTTYLKPTSGYREQVYFFEMLTDSSNKTIALLSNREGNFGVSVRFDTQQLPCFSQWKCTQAEADGYVAGLEPGTNFPNFKAFERRQGRVIEIQSGQSYTVELSLEVYPTAQHVQHALAEIEDIQSSGQPEICGQPFPPYCSMD